METEFSAEQYQSSYPDGGQDHWWPMARARVVRDTITRTAGRQASILDVGCGRGIVVDYLRREGIDCSGVEPGMSGPIEGAADFVTTGLHAEELPETDRRKYDTILLLDVIEHLPDAAEFLRGLPARFENLSTLIVTVPARQELWTNYDEYFGHYLRYSLRDIEALSQNLGWELLERRYFFHSLYLPAWFMAKVRKGRPTELSPPRGIVKALHRCVAFGMYIDYQIIPRSVVGTSLIAALRVS